MNNNVTTLYYTPACSGADFVDTETIFRLLEKVGLGYHRKQPLEASVWKLELVWRRSECTVVVIPAEQLDTESSLSRPYSLQT